MGLGEEITTKPSPKQKERADPEPGEIPGAPSLAALNRLISAMPPLVPGASQAVLGEGPQGARIAFVGEQPGDQEDIAGRPFVGPAGKLLDKAMEDADIDRHDIYITNAVKHFKFERRGKKRIHQKPTAGEVKHYRWWLMRELAFVQPGIVVSLGATAALALSGKALSVTKYRGPIQFQDFRGYITVHPSYLLRIPEDTARRQAYQDFCADLRIVRKLATGSRGDAPRRNLLGRQCFASQHWR